MDPHTDINWWNFTIDSQETDPKIRGDREVNPQASDGRFLLDYHQYIGLERVFIITHQLFELVFKQMIFDSCVLFRAFEALLEKDDRTFRSLCESGRRSLPWIEKFWRPALYASGRLEYSSNTVLPTILMYVDRRSTGEEMASLELFNPDEFMKFRENLIPASGFQTAQFRLLGKALGKSHLLSTRVFPSWKFEHCYLGEGKGAGIPLSLSDPLILGRGNQIADPPSDSPLAAVAKLDDRAHEVLCRLSPLAPQRINEISEKDSPSLEKSYVEMLTRILESDDEMKVDAVGLAKSSAKCFIGTWLKSIKEENERRWRLSPARRGAAFRQQFADSYLVCILDRIVRTDRGLHGRPGSTRESFLSKHFVTAKRQIGRDDGGTSGGGPLYLGFSIPHLFHKFPALVHYEAAVPE